MKKINLNKNIKYTISDGWKVIISLIIFVIGSAFVGFGIDIDINTLRFFGGSISIIGFVSGIVTAIHYYD